MKNNNLYFLDFLKDDKVEFSILSNDYYVVEDFLVFGYNGEIQIISLQENRFIYSINKFFLPRIFFKRKNYPKQIFIPGINYFFIKNLNKVYPDLKIIGLFADRNDFENKLKDANNIGIYLESINELEYLILDTLLEYDQDFLNYVTENIYFPNFYYLEWFEKNFQLKKINILEYTPPGKDKNLPKIKTQDLFLNELLISIKTLEF